LIELRSNLPLNSLSNQSLYISPLSVHILSYTFQYKLPAKKLAELDQHFLLVPFDQQITIKALAGPTKDFEDNVQLHSCAKAGCDIFLTRDKKLLKMKFFGSATIQKEP
jgi:predicted nucleic acid-binding protein